MSNDSLKNVLSATASSANSPRHNATAEAASHVQTVALAVLLSVVIVVVIIGNTLVILAVFTTKRLRTVTNCFVTSLAIADWMVGVFVMPPAVAYTLMGVWELGGILCDVWISLDILLCTASILSLCAISVDRYLAVTQPLSYSRRRRSKRLALSMILVVWVSSALITCPPIFGWYESGRHTQKTCRYNKNPGYVIFSAMGSFFLPTIVMLYVYVKISCVVAKRHDQLAHIDNNSRKSQRLVIKEESDILERASSECCEDQNIRCSRYIWQINACGGSSGGVPDRNSLRPALNYTSSSPHEPLTPLSRMSSMGGQRSSRPDSLGYYDSGGGANMMSAANRVSSFRRETKTAQTLSIVMGGFIACWLPFFIFYLLTPFVPSNDVNALIMSYLTWLGWFNSAINPFIYAFYSPDFRLAFWKLTVAHFTKRSRRNQAGVEFTR